MYSIYCINCEYNLWKPLEKVLSIMNFIFFDDAIR